MSGTTNNDQPALPTDISARHSAHQQAVLKGRLWTGRVLTGMAMLFLLFDAAGKFMMPPPVAQAFQRLAFPTTLGVSIGILLTVCSLLYAIPRTSVLGATLLTGYLGGAVAIQVRAGSPTFETLFPVLFGIVIWAGILLREPRLLTVFPMRRTRCR